MHVKRLRITNFRGFEQLIIKPKGHVVLMGMPGAGRSDVVVALARVLDADASRTRITTELDFHKNNTQEPISIEVILGDLGPDLEQNFLDYLELWETAKEELLPEADAPDKPDPAQHEWVLRVEHRAKWLDAEERAEEFAFYPKASDPSNDSFAHVRRRDIEALGFTELRRSSGPLLDLGERGVFRRVVERSAGADFKQALTDYVGQVTAAAASFTKTQQVKTAIESLMVPLLELLNLKPADLPQVFGFSPEGGAPTGLLRSLGPSLDLLDGSGPMPAWRRGSTVASLLRTAEVLAIAASQVQMLAVDDLGDGLDAASAIHLASVLQRRSGQSWITTRNAAVAEIFEPQEIVRMGKDAGGARTINQGKRPTNKAEAISAKHWHRNLLPALSFKAVVVVEGPNDFAALHALAIRLLRETTQPLPATRGVALLNAGFTGVGRYASVMRLAAAAREMGLRAVGVVDGDTQASSIQYVNQNLGLADVVIRLPDGCAIEAALLYNLSDNTARVALEEIAASAGFAAPTGLASLSGNPLRATAGDFIKKNSLHAQFVEALPANELPGLAVAVLTGAVEAAAGSQSGLVQL